MEHIHNLFYRRQSRGNADDSFSAWTQSGWGVPGLVTEGSTPAEILHNVQDALDALQEAWQDMGINLPPTGGLQDHLFRPWVLF